MEISRSGESLLPLYKCNHTEVGGDVLPKNCRDGIICCKTCPYKELPPTPAKKLKTFAKAIVKDIGNGMERCEQEEIDNRLAICKECPFYQVIDETRAKCKKCGCPLSSEQVYRNKLHWKSEKCPDGRW